jgi:hypothetical protein
MNRQDIIDLGRKAKYETEDYINHYMNDRAKGWPKLCLCYSTSARSGRPPLRAKYNLKRQTHP